jgi:uncharacterized protein YndB with AHSA1/START domain
MVVGSTANRDSYKVSTPSDTEIQLTRLFNAPPELVFEAMSKPEHVRQWWGRLGEGYSVPVCEIDLRVGGKWRFVNRHPQGEVCFYGEYREIERPGRLVFTEIFEQYPDTVSVVTATLVAQGKKTLFTATVKYPSQEIRDIVKNTGMEHGAGISYDRLEDLLGELQRSRM